MPQGATPTDSELIERARAGDQRAFQTIVERYEDRVAATVISMLGRVQEADDVGQETFIRLYRHLEGFRGDASLGTYVTRIAINQSLKALKRRQKWSDRFFSKDEDVEIAEPASVSDPIDERERKDLVRAALQQLNPEHRAVVVLRMLEEYSTRETAELLDVPEGTVMSRLSRALAKLEAILKNLV